MNLDSFSVGEALVHDVPRHDEESDELILTDATVLLDRELRSYFRRKIVESLSRRGLEVIADPTASPVVREAVQLILQNGDNLVEASQRVARHLDQSQNRKNPAGLLMVITGTVDDSPVVGVLKLEREQGIRLRIDARDGRTTVDLEFLRDLTLTDKTRIFKTSLLGFGQIESVETMYGRVSDDQRGRHEGTGVATFFLSTFLGCGLKANPEKATADFTAAAESFLNDDVASDDRRSKYLIALHSALDDQALDLVPNEFAQRYLEAHDRPAFLQRVSDIGLNPRVAFQKDLSLVKTSGFKLVFEHGMTLLGSNEDLERRVQMPSSDAQRPDVRIIDTVRRLSGR